MTLHQSNISFQALLSGRAARPSDSLIQLLEEHSSHDLVDQIEEKISNIANQLQEALISAAQSRRLRPDGSEPEDVAQARIRSALSLFFLALESIVYDEVITAASACVVDGVHYSFRCRSLPYADRQTHTGK